MTKVTISVMFLIVMVFSCTNPVLAPSDVLIPGQLPDSGKYNGLTAEGITTVTLFAGQDINAGTVSLVKDGDYLVVTYATISTGGSLQKPISGSVKMWRICR